MFVKMLRESFVKKTVVVKYHGKFYYINKARLNSTLNKMGMRARFDFVNENIKDILSIQITKYKKNKTEIGNEYINIDSKGNYYIFLETAIMDYKIYLDDYTVDTQEFIQKYNQETNLNKVKYNADKFLKALNKKDY